MELETGVYCLSGNIYCISRVNLFDLSLDISGGTAPNTFQFQTRSLWKNDN